MFVLNKNELPNKIMLFNNNISTLYVEGDISVLELPSIGVIGTRNPTQETKEFLQEKVTELSKENVIVSGLALGCDKIAHEACLEADGITVAVLPCGLDKPYPLMHKKLMKRIIKNGGCVISEYKPGTSPNKRRFIERDEIVAGISDKILVGECNIRSGTMHTVNFGIRFNKHIYCPSGYSGNDYILRKFYNSHEI